MTAYAALWHVYESGLQTETCIALHNVSALPLGMQYVFMCSVPLLSLSPNTASASLLISVAPSTQYLRCFWRTGWRVLARGWLCIILHVIMIMISQPLGRLQSAEIDTETPLESRLDVYNFSSLNIYNETPPRRWQICLLEGMNYRNPPLPLFEQEIGRHLSLQIQSNSLMNWSALIHTDDQRRRSESPAGARAQSAHNVFIIILIWFLWIQAWCGAEHMAFFIMGAEVLAPVLSAPEQFFSPRPGFSFFFPFSLTTIHHYHPTHPLSVFHIRFFFAPASTAISWFALLWAIRTFDFREASHPGVMNKKCKGNSVW